MLLSDSPGASHRLEAGALRSMRISTIPKSVQNQQSICLISAIVNLDPWIYCK